MTGTAESALWMASDVAAAARGHVQGRDFAITGLSIDTRSLQPGDLFIALQGHNSNGHDYTEQALSSGASGVLVSQPTAGAAVIVPDTFRALYDLASAARARSDAAICAVTGSVGKTSTKQMLAAAFEALGPTHAAMASLNNHWGVPLSLARLPVGARYAVFELGMNHAHEITPLSKLVAPHLAIITTIAPAHIQHLGTIENIALAKSEIFHGMDADGIAILPRDSAQFPILLAEARTQGLSQIYSFGEHAEADIKLLELDLQPDASRLVVQAGGQRYQFILGMPGRHQAMNALTVVAALHALSNGDAAQVQKGLDALRQVGPVSGRGNRLSILLDPQAPPLVVLDETHNANPTSVEAALKTLAQMPTAGRRIVVLGDMLELGEQEAQLHAALAEAVLDVHPDLVLTCGRLMASLHNELPFGKGRHFPDSAALAAHIAELAQPGDVVLIKGSRGAKMRLPIEALQKHAEDVKKNSLSAVTAHTG